MLMTSVSKPSSLSLQSSQNILVFNACSFELIVFTTLMRYCTDTFSSSRMHLATEYCPCTTQLCNARVAWQSFSSRPMNHLYLPIMPGAPSVAHDNISMSMACFKKLVDCPENRISLCVCLHQLCKEKFLS